MTKEEKHKAQIRIVGPNIDGHFMITDTQNNVWALGCWRGIGYHAFYSFEEAMRAVDQAITAHIKQFA